MFSLLFLFHIKSNPAPRVTVLSKLIPDKTVQSNAVGRLGMFEVLWPIGPEFKGQDLSVAHIFRVNTVSKQKRVKTRKCIDIAPVYE